MKELQKTRRENTKCIHQPVNKAKDVCCVTAIPVTSVPSANVLKTQTLSTFGSKKLST